jgi:hypothetical protein
MSNAGIEAARKRQAEMKALGIPIVRKNPIGKSNDAPKSLRLAINANCYTCVGEDHDPGWKDRVRYCEITICPLHKVRQYR